MPDFGDGSARDDYGQLDQHAPSVANGQITPAQYAEYQSRRRRDAILGSLLTVGGMTFAQPLANALGLGATGAGAATGGGGGALASGGLPPVSGGSPWALTPYATTATSVPTGAAAVGGSVGAGAGAAGAGAGGGLLAGMSARDLAALGLSAAGTIGGAMSNGGPTAPTSATDDPQMKALLEMMMGRLRKSEPNFDSVQAMAQGLLPTQYQRGGGGMR